MKRKSNGIKMSNGVTESEIERRKRGKEGSLRILEKEENL